MKIKRYQRDQLPIAQSGAAHSLPGEKRLAPNIRDASATIYKQAADLAETITGIGHKMAQAREVEQYNESILTAKERVNAYAAEMEDPAFLKTLTPAESRDLAKTYDAKMRTRVSEIVKALAGGIDEPRALEDFKTRSKELTLEYSTRARATGRRYHVERLRAKTGTQLDSLKNQFITGDMTAAADAQAVIDGMVAAGAFSADEGQRLNESWIDTAGGSYWERQIQTDPRSALKALQDGGASTYLDEDNRTALIDAARVGVRRLESERKDQHRDRAAIIKADLNDSLESILRTGQPMPGTEDMLRELTSMGGRYATASDKARVRIDTVRHAWTIYEDVKTKPFNEQQRTLDEKLKPAPGAKGYALRTEAYDLAARMVERERRAFTDDPAAYVAEETDRRMMAAGRDPHTDRPGRASLRLEIQSRYGLISQDQHILSKPESNHYRGRYARATPGEKAAMVVDLKSFGQYLPQVLKELELGYAHSFAADQRVGQAERLLQAISVKESDIGLDPDQKKDIKNDSRRFFYDDSAMGGVLANLARLTGNPEYSTMATSLAEVETKMALVAGDAERGHFETWRGYRFINEDNLAYCWVPDTYNPQDVRRAMARWRGANVESLVAHKSKQFVSSEFFNEYVHDLKIAGVFVPSGDGQGFNLVDPASGKAVTGRAGSALKITLEELGADIERIRKEKIEFQNEVITRATDPNLF